jgi:hypothetical protein
MLKEAALLPRNLSSHLLLFNFITVPVPLGQKVTVPTALVPPTLIKSRVEDPDPYPDPDWIRIQSIQWIRIRNPDPDP